MMGIPDSNSGDLGQTRCVRRQLMRSGSAGIGSVAVVWVGHEGCGDCHLWALVTADG